MQTNISQTTSTFNDAVVNTKQDTISTVAVANGPAAAAFYAGGIGAAVLGALVVISEMIPALKTALIFDKGVGALSGKTLIPSFVFILLWGVLFRSLRGTTQDIKRAVRVAYIGLAIGVLGTFPPVYEFFAALTK